MAKFAGKEQNSNQPQFPLGNKKQGRLLGIEEMEDGFQTG